MLKQQHSGTLLVTAEDLIHKPIYVSQSSTLYDAVEKILSYNISGIVVLNGEKIGVLSQKDIAKALLEKPQNMKKISCLQEMQELVLVDQYAPVSNCASLMLDKKTNALGVKGPHGLLGIMTKHDLVRFYHQNVVDETELSDIMSVGSFFVPSSCSLYDALTKMIENQISRLVVKEGDRPLGLVTYKSFLKNALTNANLRNDSIFCSDFGKTVKVKEILKGQIITVSINANLAKVAKILIDYRIHGVGVTKGQEIVGFVTEKDIVRQLSRIDV